MPPPICPRRAIARAISSSSTPTHTMLWASCATVVANAPRCSPKPRTKPTPTRPVRVMALDDGDLRDVALRGRPSRSPCCDGRQLDRASRQHLPRDDVDHAQRPLRSTARGRSESPNALSARSGAPRPAPPGRERRDGLAVEDEPPVLVDAARPERDEVVEQHEIGAVARRDRAERGRGRATARGERGDSSASSAGMPSATATRHIS